MILPGAGDVLAALEATWPAAATVECGPIRLRRGDGGGKRVSAANAIGPIGPADIARAEAGMRAMDQQPLFMLTPDDDRFDAALADHGYEIVDPVTLYAAPTRSAPVPRAATGWTPALSALWDAGGIGTARRGVMTRVAGAKTVFALPDQTAPTAAIFVARAPIGAMFHALHVDPSARRRGQGRALTEAAIGWAHRAGAPWIALAVTDANVAANALYASLGFKPVGRYWYRTSRG